MYLVGPAPPDDVSLARAAGLTCSHGFVAHGWATFVHGFGPDPHLPVDVLVASGSHDGRPGKVRVHESGVLLPRDVGDLSGIAVTSPARAILDCGDYFTVSQLEGLIAVARVKDVVTVAQLEDVLGRAGRRKAAARLAKALACGPGITRSEAERMLRRILREAGIEQPITGLRIGRYEADFAWPAYMLIVEFDSWSWHSGKRDFRHDRERNGWLTERGWSVLPVTYEQVTGEPLKTAARIAAALAIRTNR
jgi:very-short-patch-repair endonuclease